MLVDIWVVGMPLNSLPPAHPMLAIPDNNLGPLGSWLSLATWLSPPHDQ